MHYVERDSSHGSHEPEEIHRAMEDVGYIQYFFCQSPLREVAEQRHCSLWQ